MDEKKPKIINMSLPIFSLLIISISLLSSIFPGMASVIIFDRGAILSGEVWRLFTCHFVHFSNSHLAYNIFAFGIAGYVIEKKQYPNFPLLYLCLTISISTSLIILEPNMAFYGGLSGVACGTLYYCALMGIRENRTWQRICLLVVLFLPIKIAAEVFTNASILPYWEKQTFVPMQTSHIMGCTIAVLFYMYEKKRKNSSDQALHQTAGTFAALTRQGSWRGW